jgi:hypothetical protein
MKHFLKVTFSGEFIKYGEVCLSVSISHLWSYETEFMKLGRSCWLKFILIPTGQLQDLFLHSFVFLKNWFTLQKLVHGIKHIIMIYNCYFKKNVLTVYLTK